MGKLSREPYNPVTGNITTEPLELIHMDLCGPMANQSLGGSRYSGTSTYERPNIRFFIEIRADEQIRARLRNELNSYVEVPLYFFVLVDDFGRRTFVYFLKTKDETFDRFRDFKSRVENELNLKIKDVRTDNGTEFINDRFKGFLIKNGIHHQLTTTYSPQRNGVAERINRTIVETARTLFFINGFHRRAKAKTSLEDDDVPIDDTTTKPLFTPQENGRKGTRDKVPKLRWNPWQKHVKSTSVSTLIASCGSQLP
ncbi:hypothetical protein LAZ67_16001961 [Cordylochernes scorpioides]|uniref:Integrase catalytic domain-containing protein n=1 Tax=Cordylochernes scorpioides TaxID=51811 RepID=A0ABY6LBJ7_9ARAC|nr:hypothetical protein LAZ67_16001961 [Cordylochernes scorpioides]